MIRLRACRVWLLFLLSFVPFVPSLSQDVMDVHNMCYDCRDYEEDCEQWASDGECEANAHYMLWNCRQSCRACENEAYIFEMGAPQNLLSSNQLKEIVEEAREHLRAVARNPDLRHILEHCKNLHEECTYWASLGHCETERYFMDTHCCPVCSSSGQLEFLLRCPMDPDEPNVWEPGDVNAFFHNLTTREEYQKYEPRVLSRPKLKPGDRKKTANYRLGSWVVLLEKFLTDEEANRLIELGTVLGFEPSLDGGPVRPDGTSDAEIIKGRTSMNSWCRDECYSDPLAQQVIQRIAEITNIPEENSDYLQLLRYEVGQFYHTHHDYHNYQMYSATGVRILTVFLYLNDVEEGGGTNFPYMNITVMPQRGRALVWSNVLDEDPNQWDMMTHHQALPVVRGVKYGANAWLHPRNYKTPAAYGCAE